jgi:hypothetical protein
MIAARQKEFIRHLHAMAGSRFVVDVFADVVGLFASAIERPLTNHADECDERYKSLVAKYTKDEAAHCPEMMAILVEALEENRESFLGPILEGIGAANTRNGQFLTPASFDFA